MMKSLILDYLIERKAGTWQTGIVYSVFSMLTGFVVAALKDS